MFILTEDAIVQCKHDGSVGLVPSQTLVAIAGRKVLVEPDPEARPITTCPMYGPGLKPCTTTLRVTKGYSGFVSIGGRRVCLDAVTGLTDGTPPGTVNYVVREPGQSLVEEVS